jgi:hypothetical protein
MDSGQLIYVLCRLVLGGLASFLAIMLWSRTRDTAWMFMVMGVISAYAETIHVIVNFLGEGSGNILAVDTVSPLSILLTCIPIMFFIAGFSVMVARKYRHR